MSTIYAGKFLVGVVYAVVARFSMLMILFGSLVGRRKSVLM